LTEFSRTPFLASAQRDQVVDDRDLPIKVPVTLGRQRRIEEGLSDTCEFLEGILDWDWRLNRGEDGIIDR